MGGQQSRKKISGRATSGERGFYVDFIDKSMKNVGSHIDAIVCFIGQDWICTDELNETLILIGGNIYENSCNHLQKKYPECQVGDVFLGKSGKLPCDIVMYSVMPQHPAESEMENYTKQVAMAIEMVIQKAQEAKLSSIGFPVVTGEPCPISSELLAIVYYQYVRLDIQTSLRHVHLLTIDREIYIKVCKTFDDMQLGVQEEEEENLSGAGSCVDYSKNDETCNAGQQFINRETERDGNDSTQQHSSTYVDTGICLTEGETIEYSVVTEESTIKTQLTSSENIATCGPFNFTGSDKIVTIANSTDDTFSVGKASTSSTRVEGRGVVGSTVTDVSCITNDKCVTDYMTCKGLNFSGSTTDDVTNSTMCDGRPLSSSTVSDGRSATVSAISDDRPSSSRELSTASTASDGRTSSNPTITTRSFTFSATDSKTKVSKSNDLFRLQNFSLSEERSIQQKDQTLVDEVNTVQDTEIVGKESNNSLTNLNEDEADTTDYDDNYDDDEEDEDEEDENAQDKLHDDSNIIFKNEINTQLYVSQIKQDQFTNDLGLESHQRNLQDLETCEYDESDETDDVDQIHNELSVNTSVTYRTTQLEHFHNGYRNSEEYEDDPEIPFQKQIQKCESSPWKLFGSVESRKVQFDTTSMKESRPKLKAQVSEDAEGSLDFSNIVIVPPTKVQQKKGVTGRSAIVELPNDVVEQKSQTYFCVICQEEKLNHFQKKLDKCDHVFCKECIDTEFECRPVCPVCSKAYGERIGNMPPGLMSHFVVDNSLPGFEGEGTIIIEYDIPNGIQTDQHPNPGVEYKGTQRTALLPNTDQGNIVLKMLIKAFEQKLTFTIGRSLTTGKDNVVTWNDIHHKTSAHGGPSRFGYPDPDYLNRIEMDLRAKGIKPD